MPSNNNNNNNNNNMSFTAGDDKFALANERDHFGHRQFQPPPPPSYDFQYSESPSTMTTTSGTLNSAIIPRDRDQDIDQLRGSPRSFYSQPERTSSTAKQVYTPYVMSDEERYPTVVEEDPGLQHYQRTDSNAALNQNSEGIVMSPLSRNLETLGKAEAPLVAPPPGPLPPRRIWGLRRRNFFIMLSAFILLAATGLTVGLVVGLKVAKKTARTPAIAASGLYVDANGTDWNTAVFHTNMTTGALQFRLNTGGRNWSMAMDMDLEIVPEVNAAMSSTSMLGSDGLVYLNLFYIYQDNIVLANVSCANVTCRTVYNAAITRDVTYPLASDSALSAIYMGSSGGWRVFYHNTDRYVTQLASTGDGNWDHGQTISGKSLKGSSIAASPVSSNLTSMAMNVLYVDAKAKTLYTVQFGNGMWRNPVQVANSSVSHWNPVSPLTSAYVPDSDSLIALFTGTDSLIYQFTGKNASTETFAEISRGDTPVLSTSGITTPGWDPVPYHDLTWLKSDTTTAQIACMAWANSAKFYRLVNSQLAENALTNGVWSASFVARFGTE